MKATLKVQLGQQLTMTPHLLQSIRLLQLDVMSLEQEVRRELDNNPLLETDEDSDGAEDAVEIASELVSSHAWEQGSGSSEGGDDDIFARLPAAQSTDMRLQLLEQFGMRAGSSADLALAAFILDHVSDSGYLEVGPEDLVERARAVGLDPDRLETVRQLLMRCEPEGIGARSLRECLAVQLAELAGPVAGRALARRIINEHLELLASHDPARIARALKIDAEQAAEAMAVVLRLDPRPGARLSKPADAVVPDVRIERARNGWRVTLNRRCTPRIRVNPVYEEMLQSSEATPQTGPMRDLLQQARWFSRGLATRHDTLLKVTAAIVARQGAFLGNGPQAMVPLTLKQIADEVGVHESTVSRVTTGKYVQTPCGTFELKHFFAVKLDGAGVAGVAVQSIVKKLIDGETPSAPLADDVIVVLLARQGIRIARRTVAKYRDLLGIPSARQRQRAPRGFRDNRACLA